MLSLGLLDPIEPWRLGSEILPKHSICAGRQRCSWFGKYKSRGKSTGGHFTRHSSYYEPAAPPSLDKLAAKGQEQQ
ncbi:mCG54713 [Mus musculus]|nr:mCG54713 [Mus musculus]